MTIAAQPRVHNDAFQEYACYQRDLPAISATGTYAIGTPSTTRSFVVDRVEIMVDATYAADPSNYYATVLEFGAGPTSVATWSTQSTAQGALTADTPAQMVLSGTPANLVVPPGGVISFLATKNASAANITPRVVVHGRII